MKYAPGPWKAQADDYGYWGVYDKDDNCIVEAAEPDGYLEDIQLMAAAPDAVKSLRALVEHCEDYAIYLKTLGPEFRNDYLNVKNEINKAAGILRDIDDTE